MKCSVEGCCKEIRYKAKALCQMHYFRQMRNGDFELMLDKKKRELGYSRRPRVTMPGKGYVRVYDPSHPLADTSGYVSEHRKVVFGIIGYSLCRCELCGESVDWKTVHIDHIDRNVSNNASANLRPLCRACNTFRDYPEQISIAGRISVTYQGETKTPEEWSRDSRVSVAGYVIRNRIKSGMSAEQALFSPKKTHNGNVCVDSRPRKTQFKHERRNAVSITLSGVTMTAAEWSRHPECQVSEASVIDRIRAGWTEMDAVFKPKRVAKVKELKRGQD